MCQIKDQYVSAKEITPIVKKALAERFGRENVSVVKGRGTASGWVEAEILTDAAHDCFCQPREPYCDRCREKLREIGEEGRKIVYLAMEKAEAKFSTYYSDDGFGNDRDCFLLQVHRKVIAS